MIAAMLGTLQVLVEQEAEGRASIDRLQGIDGGRSGRSSWLQYADIIAAKPE